MPGKRSTETIISDYITDPALYRTITASDAADPSLIVDAPIDLTHSAYATTNKLAIIPIRTSGTGKIKFDVYVQFPNGTLPNNPFLLQTTTQLVDSKQILFLDRLFAGSYVLRATLSAAANFGVYVMKTDLPV